MSSVSMCGVEVPGPFIEETREVISGLREAGVEERHLTSYVKETLARLLAKAHRPPPPQVKITLCEDPPPPTALKAMWKGVVASSLSKGQSAAKEALLSKIEAYPDESTEGMFLGWVKRVNAMGTGRFMTLSLQMRQLSVVHHGFTNVKGLSLVVRVGVMLKQLDVAAWKHVRSITIEPVPGRGRVSSLRFPEISGVSFKLKSRTHTYVRTKS